MRKIIGKILLLSATFVVAFGFGTATVSVNAEESAETPAISVETVEDSGENTSVEETPEAEENEEKTSVETTFDGFLEWSKQEAEKHGYGDEYTQAIEAIKTAATTKQVTLSTIASFSIAFAIIGHIVYDKIKDKKMRSTIFKMRSAIFDLAKQNEKQIKGTNAVIDGENALIDGETKILNAEQENGKAVQKTQEEIKGLKKGFSAFVSAFLRFTDGVKLGENKKSEVQTNCLKALQEIDGEVRADENNKV